METIRNGQLSDAYGPADWWKRLRYWKRSFWKREQAAGKREAERQEVERS